MIPQIMATVHDLAAYIIKKRGRMSAMKLQNLVYYSQAWSLVWDDAPLFKEEIEAWANGPVAPVLYETHRGMFSIVPPWPKGKTSNLNSIQKETVNVVLNAYAKLTAYALSELTHREAPWRNARKGIPPGERGSVVISHAAMAEYYGGLVGTK